MKAVRVNQWGQPITLDEAPQPAPTNGEVLVRVRAASINPVDGYVAASYLKDMQQLPLTVGTDFAGDVVSLGADVTHVKVGDAVYGMIPMRGGAFAEYAVVKGNEVARTPITELRTGCRCARRPSPLIRHWLNSLGEGGEGADPRRRGRRAVCGSAGKSRAPM